MKDSNSEISENSLELSKDYTFWGLIKELILFGLFLLFFGAIVGGIFLFIFGFEWVFTNYLLIFYLLGYPFFLGMFTIWIKLIKKKDFRDFMLGKPKIPGEGHRWIYIILIAAGIIISIIYTVFFLIGGIRFVPNFPRFLISIYTTVFGAGIVEEIFFRGYLYSRCEDVFGQNRHLITWTRELYDKQGVLFEKPFMTFEISYAAIVSSLIFAAAHLQYYLVFMSQIFIFFIGLVLCKARNDWDSLIPGMIIHGAWNAYVVINGIIEVSADYYVLFYILDVYIIGIALLFIAILYKIISDHRKFKKRE